MHSLILIVLGAERAKRERDNGAASALVQAQGGEPKIALPPSWAGQSAGQGAQAQGTNIAPDGLDQPGDQDPDLAFPS